MSDSELHNIPENDPDLRLAKMLKSDRTEIQDSEDKALLELIDKYTKQMQKKQSVYHVDSDGLWNRIEEQLVETPQLESPKDSEIEDQAPVVIFSFKRYLAIAALLLLSISLLYVAQQFKGQNDVGVIAEAADSPKVVTLADGTTITLRNNSQLSKTENGAYSVSGQAYFSVAKNQPNPFVVDLDGATVTVLGTEFSVVNFENEKSVFVSEGKVRFSDSDEEVILEMNNFARISESNIISGTDTGKTALDWMENTLVLESTSVKDLTLELALHYKISIDVDSSLLEEKVSGILLFSTQKDVFQQLERILNARFISLSDSTFQLKQSE